MTQATGTQDNEQANANAQPHDSGAGETPSTPETWEAWLDAQPEDQRAVISGLYEKQTSGLQAALKDERDLRKDFERQLRKAAKSETDGSEAQQRLATMADELEKANRRADFLEQATRPEVGLVDAKAAWKLVSADPDTFLNQRGEVDLSALKAEYPYLFAQAQGKKLASNVNANAGNGAGTDPGGGTPNMNDWIRQPR